MRLVHSCDMTLLDCPDWPGPCRTRWSFPLICWYKYRRSKWILVTLRVDVGEQRWGCGLIASERKGEGMYRLVEWFYCVSLSIWMPCRWVIPAWHRVDTFFLSRFLCLLFLYWWYFCLGFSNNVWHRVVAFYVVWEYGVMYRVWGYV